MDNNNQKKSVRQVLLMGVFWRILIIEALLLIFSLWYRWYDQGTDMAALFWYGVRIIGLVIVIIVFMMITLRRFLDHKIIKPLEAIALANKNFERGVKKAGRIKFPESTPQEILSISTTRESMLKSILEISEERLRFSRALKNELEKGRKIQREFLPEQIPEHENCDIKSVFYPALQLSGDFYDVFDLPENHVGFVVGDVSDKGVGAALFMALIRSLIRIFSGVSGSVRDIGDKKAFTPREPLGALSFINEYLSKEHGSDGMFISLFYGILNLQTGEVFYVNCGHEPAMILNKERIAHHLNSTGPALGPIEEAVFEIKSVTLHPGDIIFSYTDGVTEARSPDNSLYTRTRLEKFISGKHQETSAAFLTSLEKDLSRFTEEAPQADDITMLAVRWQPQGGLNRSLQQQNTKQ